MKSMLMSLGETLLFRRLVLWALAFWGAFATLNFALAQETPMQSVETVEVQPATSNASTPRWGFAFGLPDFFVVHRRLEWSRHRKLRLSVGGFPVDRLVGIDQAASSMDWSETYRMVFDPRATVWTFGWHWEQSWTPRSAMVFGASLHYLSGGAVVNFERKSDGRSVPAAELEVTLFQPVLRVAYQYRWTWSRSALSAELGLGYLLPKALEVRRGGALPSFLEVADEYRDAVEDGSDAAASVITDSLHKATAPWLIFPTLQVSYWF